MFHGTRLILRLSWWRSSFKKCSKKKRFKSMINALAETEFAADYNLKSMVPELEWHRKVLIQSPNWFDVKLIYIMLHVPRYDKARHKEKGHQLELLALKWSKNDVWFAKPWWFVSVQCFCRFSMINPLMPLIRIFYLPPILLVESLSVFPNTILSRLSFETTTWSV